tara:strand:+ start:95 stop:712 length:618 start_codon:yes stop_codon:yes gene_type:complete
MGGILQLLRQLIQSGSGIGNALARRYLPARFHRTKTDEGIKYMKETADTMGKYMGRSLDELDVIAKNKIAQGQKIIDDVQKIDPKFANQAAVRRAFNEINKEIDDLMALSNTLREQSRLATSFKQATRIMDQANQMEKTAALMKSALPVLGGFAGGMYLGARSEDANPDFYRPETDPFRDPPSRQMGDAVGEALEDMENKVNGRE